MFYKLSLKKWIFNKAVRKSLSDDFKKDNIACLLSNTWNLHQDIPKSSTRNMSRMVSLLLSSASNSIAMYRALIEMGIPDKIAKKYIEKVNWEIGKYIGAPIYFLSKICIKKPLYRINWINDLLWKYLFTEPFKRVPVESDADVAFNVIRCPFHEYFKSQDLLELCESASCCHDYLLAEEWHSKFVRTQTLASGSDHCDFRFYTSDRR